MNLKQPRGRDAFLRLAAQADVVIENFRPRVKDRLGIDYAALRAVNPRIILASLSGFGQNGPYVERPAFDQIVQGMGGLMSVTGLPGGGPVRAGIPVADLATGLNGAIGILVALLEREASGEGQWVQTSLIESQIAMMDFQAARYLMKGDVPRTAGNNHPTSIPTGLFATRRRPHQHRRRQRPAVDTVLPGRRHGRGRGPILPSPAARCARRTASASTRRSPPAWPSKTTAQWMQILVEAEIPCGPVYDMAESFDDPQIASLAMRHPIDHPRLGRFDVVAQPITMSRSRPETQVPAPERGQHTDEVLKDFGFSSDDIDDLRRDGAL